MAFFIVWNFSGNKRTLEVMSESEIMSNGRVELALGEYKTKSEAHAALSADLNQLASPPFTVLASRKCRTLASSWREILGIRQNEQGAWQLFTGRYEILGTKADNHNREAEDCDLPNRINDQPIMGAQDDHNVGSSIIDTNEGTPLNINHKLDGSAFRTWLDAAGWSVIISESELTDKLISNLLELGPTVIPCLKLTLSFLQVHSPCATV